MKARLVRAEFWTDEKVVQLSPFARLLFIACWQLADDEGRFEWEPLRMKMQIFPVDTVDIGTLGEEMIRVGLIRVYPALKKTFCAIPNFLKHQKIHPDRPSKYPPPPDEIGPERAEVGQAGPERAENRPSPYPNPHPFPSPNPCPKPIQGEGEAATPPALPPRAAKAVKEAGFRPPTDLDLLTHCKELNLDMDGWMPEIRKFKSYYTATGWKSKDGAPITDWQAAFDLWRRRAFDYADAQKARARRRS